MAAAGCGSCGGQEGGAQEGDLQSISQRAKTAGGAKPMLVIGLVFTVVGSALFVPLFALPMTRLARSATWDGTPCTILSSQVRSWETDDGYSYRADVHYEYVAGGATWRSNRVDFFSIVTSGRDSARAIRDRFERGTTHTCFVDPKNPSNSVLDRRLRPIHLLGAISLLFLLAGLALAKHGWKKLRTGPGQATALVETDPELPVAEGPVDLEPQMGPWKKVFGTVFFAVFWNGIVSVFLLQVVKSHQRGDPEWFLTVFLIPFVLVGIGSVGFVFYFLLATANPRPKIRLLSGHPRLGDELIVRVGHSAGGRAGSRASPSFSRAASRPPTGGAPIPSPRRKSFRPGTLIDTGNDWEITRGADPRPDPR